MELGLNGVELGARVPEHVDPGEDGGMKCTCEWSPHGTHVPEHVRKDGCKKCI